MLSAKQRVVVQDCTQTGNNNELRKGQRSGRKTAKTDQKVICWHKISREKPLQAAWRSSKPREKVLQTAREIFTARAKFWQNRTDRNDFARDTKDFTRDTKRFRAKVQTSLLISTKFEVVNKLFRPIGQIFKTNFNEQAEKQARRTASKWYQARLKTMRKGKSNLAHEQSSDLVRANS